MGILPGTIALGTFRIIYEEERQRSSSDAESYLLQQRALIRLDEDLVRLADQEDYTVYCNDDEFKRQAGKRPSALQYFIASVGFCMFSQLKRLAAQARVVIDDLEIGLAHDVRPEGKLFSRQSGASRARDPLHVQD